MKKNRGSAPGEQPMLGKQKSLGNPLGFSLEFCEGFALVRLTNRRVAERILVEQLSLEVPDVRFPFDVSGGAEQFRHHRCRLRTIVISLVQEDAERALAALLEPASYGFEKIRVIFDRGQGLLCGRWGVGGESAPFTARFVAEAEGGAGLAVRLGFFEIRVFGWVPLPATALVAQLGLALKPLGVQVQDAAFLVINPVSDLVRWLLPVHGWKVPDLDGLRADRIELSEGKSRLISVRFPDEIPEGASGEKAHSLSDPLIEQQYLVFKEGTEAYRNAELALREGKLEKARKLYLGKAGVEPSHPHAARRMLEIGGGRPERFDEVEDIIRDLLSRDKDYLPALFTQAALQDRRKDQAAGYTYEQIGRICAERGEREDAIIAHLKAGSVLRDTDPDKAIWNHERALELDPDLLEAMQTLTGLYQTGKHWYRALRMNLRLAGRLEQPAEVAECHIRMGKIYLEQFDDVDNARKHFDAALIHDPDNLGALAAQATVHQRRGQPTRAVKLLMELVKRADEAGKDELVLETRMRLAGLWEEDLGDLDSALLHYQRILNDYPDQVWSLGKVGSITSKQGRWDEASAAFGRLLEIEAGGGQLPPEVIMSTCLGMGHIYRMRPGGMEEARSYFQRAVALDQSSLNAWLELEAIDREEQDWSDLVEVLERKAALLDAPEAVLAATLEAARLADRQLGERRRAEELYFRALQVDPISVDAIQGLRILLGDEQRWQELVEILVRAASQDSDAKRAATRWAEAAEIRIEKLDLAQAGTEALELSVQLDPGNRRNAERLLGLFKEQERFDGLVELVGRLTGEGWEAKELTDLWLMRAQILREKLGRTREAAESYRKVLDLAPGLLQAHRALADLYHQSQEWELAREAILQVFQCAGEAGLEQPEETELHRRLAEVELALGNREAAIEQYRMVLARREDDKEASSRLEQLLGEDRKWEELAALYARRAEAAEGETAASLHAEAAKIWLEKLKKLEPAAIQYKLAVDVAPQSGAAGQRLASLQRVYVAQGLWKEVAEVIQRRISVSAPREAVPLYMARAAVLSSHLNLAAAAEKCWEELLAIDPNYRPALLMLARRRYHAGRYQEALSFGERALSPHLPGPRLLTRRQAQVALDAARAACFLDKLDDAARMFSVHLEAFASQQYAGVDLEALEGLELLLKKLNRHQELALLYRRWLASGRTPERRGTLLRALALILFDQLNQSEEALGILSRYVGESPGDQPAVSDLLQLLRRASKWEQLAGVLEEQWQQAPQQQQRIERLAELAEVYQLHLRQPDQAIARWNRLRELGYQEAQTRLLSIYRQEGRHQELAEQLRLLAEGAADPKQAGAYLGELGLLARDQLGNPELALESFRRVFAIDPSGESLEALLEQLRRMADPKRQEGLLLAYLDGEREPRLRKRFLLEHAELCISGLEKRAQGLASLREAISIEPDDLAIQRAQALYEQQGDWEEVLRLQQILVDLAGDSATTARRVHRLGRLALEKLGEPERATAAFERAIELDPGWLVPMSDLAEILEQGRDWSRLVALRGRMADASKDREERSEHLQEAARLAFQELGDYSQGLDLLEKAAEQASDPIPVLKKLADRCEEAGMHSRAADALDRVVAAHGDIAEATETPASLFRRIAELRRQAGEEDAAIAAYQQTLRQEPSDEALAARLESIYRAKGRFVDLARMLEDLASRKTGQPAADAFVSAARCWLEASDRPAARLVLEQALSVQPGHDEASVLTAQLLQEQHAWPELFRFLESLPDHLLAREEVGGVARACYDNLISQLESPASKLHACRVVLRADPNNLSVLWRTAHLLQESGEAEEAESVLRRLDAQADRLEADDRYQLDLSLAGIDFSRGNTEGSERRLKRCVQARPEDPAPRAFLHKLFTGGRRFADQVALLVDEAERAQTSAERFEHYQAAAELMERELGDPQGAANLYRRVVVAEPGNLEGWRRLAELQRLLNNPQKQREALIRVAELSSGEEQILAMRKAVRLTHEGLGDLRAARAGWTAIVQKLPNDTEALDRLLELDRREGAFEELEQHLERRIAVAEDPAALALLLRERAAVLMEKLKRPAEAVPVLEWIEQLQPADGAVLERLDVLYQQQQKWSELARVLGKRIKLAGSERERAALWSKLAGVRQQRLDDPPGAVEALRNAIALDPEDRKPLEQLRKLAASGRDDALLAEALEALAARASSKPEEHLLRRSVGLLRWALGQRDEARRTLARALALSPEDVITRRFLAEILAGQDSLAAATQIRWLLDHQPALTKRDIRKLKRQLVEALDDAEASERIEAMESLLESVPDDLDTAQRLAGLYRETGNLKRLADLLARMGEMEVEVGKAPLWIQRGEILLEEGDALGAAEAFARALDIEGDHRHQVAHQLARVQLDQLRDGPSAVTSLEIALDIQPDDTATLQQLSDLLWSLNRLEEAEAATQRLIAGVEEKKLLPGLLVRLGEIQHRRDNLSEAQASFEQAIRTDPTYLVAYQRLEELLGGQLGDRELAGFYLKWAKSPAAGSLRASLYAKAAHYLKSGGDAAEAVGALRESLKQDPANPEVCEALAAVLASQGNWEELLQVLHQRRALTGDAARGQALTFEMGEVCKEHLKDGERAAVYFEEILQLDPHHAGALEELADVRYEQKEWGEVASLYEQLGDKGLASRAFINAFRKGEVAEALSDPQAALQHYRRSIELNPVFIPSRQKLIDLLGKLDRWQEVVQSIEKLLVVLPQQGFEDVVVDMWRQLGRAQRRLLCFEEAARCFHEVIKRNPNDLEALKRLREFFTNRMSWKDAVACTRRELELESDSADAAERWAGLGDVYSLRLDDAKKAQEAYRQAIQLAPDSLEQKWKLWKFLRTQGEWGELQKLGATLLEGRIDAQRQAEVHRVLARACLKSEDRQAALVHFESALALGQADIALVEEVAEVARSQGRWALYGSLAGQALESRLQQGLNPEEALEKYLRLAGVYQEHLGDIRRAAGCIRRALELHPRDPELLRRLGNLYASDWGTYQEAIEVFRELAGMNPVDPELYRYLARLEATRGEMDRSACYYSSLRFLVPMDQEARNFIDQCGPVSFPSRALSQSEWNEVFLHPAADCLLQRIMSVLAQYLEKLFPADLARYGVRADQQASRENYPTVLEVADHARQLVSGRPLSVLVMPSDTYGAWLESGETPVIILSKAVLERSTPAELRFFLTREVVAVAMGFVLPRKLSQADLLQLLALLCKIARPEGEPPVPLPQTAPQYLAAIERAVPADALETVVPLIRRYSSEPRAHELGRWITGVRQTADRVGLLASGDIHAALSTLARFSEAAGGRDLAFIPDRGTLISRDKEMVELLRFAHSEQYLQVRKKLGVVMAVPPTTLARE